MLRSCCIAGKRAIERDDSGVLVCRNAIDLRACRIGSIAKSQSAGAIPDLQRFLARVGATLSWEPNSRYVVITTADRRTLTFTLGVPHFQTSSGGESVPLRAYIDGNDVYLPFLTLARALYVEPVLEGGQYVLQPQIGAMNVRTEGRRTLVSLIGGTPLRFTKDIDEPGRMTLVFRGASSTLSAVACGRFAGTRAHRHNGRRKHAQPNDGRDLHDDAGRSARPLAVDEPQRAGFRVWGAGRCCGRDSRSRRRA